LREGKFIVASQSSNGRKAKNVDGLNVITLPAQEREPDMTYCGSYIRAALAGKPIEAPDAHHAGWHYEALAALHDAYSTGGKIALAWQVIERARPELADLAKQPPRKLYLADELADLPARTWLIENELVENGLNVLFGPSGSGKSFVALDYAERTAADGNPVVYIAGEGASGYHARHRAWIKHHRRSANMNLSFWLDSVNMLDEKGIAEFTATLAEAKIAPRLIIIDTLARCMLGGDENSARDMGLFIDACNRLQRELNTAVLVVHHTGKSGASERGSSALRGAADMMIELQNDEGVIRLSCSKAKDSAGFDTRYLQLIQVGDSCVLNPTDKTITETSRLTDNQKQVIEWLSSSDIFDEGARSNDLQKATNIPAGTFWRVLRSLDRRGLIEKTGKYDPWLLTREGKELAEELGYAKHLSPTITELS